MVKYSETLILHGMADTRAESLARAMDSLHGSSREWTSATSSCCESSSPD